MVEAVRCVAKKGEGKEEVEMTAIDIKRGAECGWVDVASLQTLFCQTPALAGEHLDVTCKS